ncbi:vancomycin high temperature exclusion protein [Streptomonospora nanhaiensis]|uniref:SanA/YdcF family protein n=1 Tax=Streptomonospora nanhaiensis TaxID=1323731 RepID=UPI001C9960D7|nr:ElyC/SanA/YdcF family protein [Streptomonospora nanhaiensis]MBX9391529.1 YdcF family protein [Streptomonospora nanhaiensis]
MGPKAWAGVGAAVAAAALGPTVWSYAASAGRRTRADRAPECPVAIVLGAGATPNGPSALLAARLALAARLYHDGRVRVLLVSGDNRARSHHETDTMAARLVHLGVPADAIVADPHGYRTYDTAVRARRVFGVDRAVVVTQAFHVPRTVALCRAAGVDAYGVGDPSLLRRPRATALGYWREIGANAKGLLDTLRRAPATVEEPPRDDLRTALS